MQNNPFDRMKSKINKGITTVTVKTSSSVEKAKLNTHMESLGCEIERLKQELGGKVYILWDAENFDLSKVEEELQKIKEKKETLSRLQKQLEEIDEQANSILGKAGESSFSHAVGCICSNCGSQYEQKINFCVKCGNKIG